MKIAQNIKCLLICAFAALLTAFFTNGYIEIIKRLV